jgi:hypothetical protein
VDWSGLDSFFRRRVHCINYIMGKGRLYLDMGGFLCFFLDHGCGGERSFFFVYRKEGGRDGAGWENSRVRYWLRERGIRCIAF